MIITFNGDHGSGKSTIAQKVAEALDYKRYYLGQIFRDMAKERGMTLEEFHQLCDKSPETDKKVDEYAVGLSKKYDNFVIEGRTLWHFIPKSLKIYLRVSDEEGARRIFKELQKENKRNEGNNLNSEKEVLESIIRRKKRDNERYLKYYGIKIRNKENYDLFLDTTNLSIEEVFDKVMKFVNSKIKK